MHLPQDAVIDPIGSDVTYFCPITTHDATIISSAHSIYKTVEKPEEIWRHASRDIGPFFLARNKNTKKLVILTPKLRHNAHNEVNPYCLQIRWCLVAQLTETSVVGGYFWLPQRIEGFTTRELKGIRDE
jgi:hypothetical protein